MSDFERKLSDALKDATSGYRPEDPHAAKQVFMARFRRRRLVLASASVAAAAAAALVAVMVVPAFLDRDDEPLPPATEPARVTTIAVGANPSGIAFGNGHVFVANAGDGTVSVIDPASDSVVDSVEIGGTPDDVAFGFGAVWVTDAGAGTVTRIGFEGSLALPDEPVTIGEPGRHLDIAAGDGGIWVVSEGDALYRIDPANGEAAAIDGETLEAPTDVAAGHGYVVVLDRSVLVRIDPATLAMTQVTEVAVTRNQDLQLSRTGAWIANGDAGEVVRVDLETGDPSSPVYVGGNFTAVASSDAFVWLVSGDAGPDGVLTRVDPDTSEIVGDHVRLEDRPYDIATGEGSIWVANYAGGSVTRLDPNALPTDGGEEPSPTVGRPLFAFSGDGDIYIEDIEGTLHQITDSPEDELYPSFAADANAIAFVRTDHDTRRDVVVRDLITGEEVSLGEGEWPAFGPDGRLAYVRANRGGGTTIVVTRPGSGEEASFAPWPDGDPVDVRNITWDVQGRYVYYEAGWEGGYGLYQGDPQGDTEPLQLTPRNRRSGAAFRAPAVRGRTAVHVIQLCCEPSYDTAELGVIRFTEGGPQYGSVTAFDPRRLPAQDVAGEAALAPAGSLRLASGSSQQRTWRRGPARSWLVATGNDIWLVDERGRSKYVSDLFGFDGYAGLAVAPQYRQ